MARNHGPWRVELVLWYVLLQRLVQTPVADNFRYPPQLATLSRSACSSWWVEPWAIFCECSRSTPRALSSGSILTCSRSLSQFTEGLLHRRLRRHGDSQHRNWVLSVGDSVRHLSRTLRDRGSARDSQRCCSSRQGMYVKPPTQVGFHRTDRLLEPCRPCSLGQANGRIRRLRRSRSDRL